VEMDCIGLGANCAELDCIGLGDKLCGTGLYKIGANCVELDCIGLGGQIVWNWTV
jgi:hypothetical protein